MLRIYVSPIGREQLLSNLEIRNSMYGKVLTIIVDCNDLVVNGEAVSSAMIIYSPVATEPIVASVDSNSINVIKSLLSSDSL